MYADKIPFKIKKIIKLFVLLLFLFLVVCSISWMSYYEFYAKQEIEQHLIDTSESILLESANDTEKVQQIIRWEKDLFLSPPDPFNKWYEQDFTRINNINCMGTSFCFRYF